MSHLMLTFLASGRMSIFQHEPEKGAISLNFKISKEGLRLKLMKEKEGLRASW